MHMEELGRKFAQVGLAEPYCEMDMPSSLSRFTDPLLLQERDRGSHNSTPPSNFEAAQPLRESRRLVSNEAVNKNKAHNEELRFLREKVNDLETTSKSVPAIGVVLANIQRRLEAMEAGDRYQILSNQPGRGISEEVCEFDHTDGIDDKVMPKRPAMSRRIKENNARNSLQAPKPNKTRSYYTRTRSHVEEKQKKRDDYASDSSSED